MSESHTEDSAAVCPVLPAGEYDSIPKSVPLIIAFVPTVGTFVLIRVLKDVKSVVKISVNVLSSNPLVNIIRIERDEAIERKPASTKAQLNEATLSSNTGNRVKVTQADDSFESTELQHILSLAGIRK